MIGPSWFQRCAQEKKGGSIFLVAKTFFLGHLLLLATSFRWALSLSLSFYKKKVEIGFHLESSQNSSGASLFNNHMQHFEGDPAERPGCCCWYCCSCHHRNYFFSFGVAKTYPLPRRVGQPHRHQRPALQP